MQCKLTMYVQVFVSAFFALAVMVAASTPHKFASFPGVESSVHATALCVEQLGPGGHEPSNHASSNCCDACALSSIPLLPDPAPAAFAPAVEIAHRLFFIHQFGRAPDAQPDDLRSRAPPVLS